MIDQGLIVSSYGRQFIVRVAGKDYQAVTRGKKTDYVVGDWVKINYINQEQVQILEYLPRSCLIYRSDANRSKIIASNISQILIVIAVKPNFNIQFLNRCLICAESSNIKPIIIINKIDLPESVEFISKIIALYQDKLGYEVGLITAKSNCDELRLRVNNEVSLLIGQSGVGKSTIINQLIPNTNARVGEITKAETSGSHTTTNATLFKLNETSSIIDSPGMQEFGLHHLKVEALMDYFPELRTYHGKCKFRNCLHNNEPGCLINQDYINGVFDNQRIELLKLLIRELTTKLNY